MSMSVSSTNFFSTGANYTGGRSMTDSLTNFSNLFANELLKNPNPDKTTLKRWDKMLCQIAQNEKELMQQKVMSSLGERTADAKEAERAKWKKNIAMSLGFYGGNQISA